MKIVKNIFNWLGSGFFRSCGRFLFYFALGLFAFALFNHNMQGNSVWENIKSHMFNHMYVKAWGGPLNTSWSDTGVSQFQCNSNHNNCSISKNPTLKNPGNVLPYFACTNVQCPNNSYNSDQIGFFRVRAAFGSDHSFDSDCMYRLTYSFILTGYNGRAIVDQNLDSINSNIVFYQFNIGTNSSASGSYSADFFFNARFEKSESSSSVLKLIITFRPTISGLHYADMQFGIKDPSFSNYNWNTIIPFRGFEKITYSGVNIHYTRNSTEIDDVNNYYNEQQWNNVTTSINNVENSVNETNNILNDTDVTDSSNQASDFINNFSSDGDGYLTQLVQIPFTFLRSLVLGDTNDLCFTFRGVTSCLPNGQKTIWNKDFTGHNSILGGVINNTSRDNFKAFFNLVAGGLLAYKIILDLIHKVHEWLTPDKSEVEVMEL